MVTIHSVYGRKNTYLERLSYECLQAAWLQKEYIWIAFKLTDEANLSEYNFLRTGYKYFVLYMKFISSPLIYNERLQVVERCQ